MNGDRAGTRGQALLRLPVRGQGGGRQLTDGSRERPGLDFRSCMIFLSSAPDLGMAQAAGCMHLLQLPFQRQGDDARM